MFFPATAYLSVLVISTDPCAVYQIDGIEKYAG